ncbi:MAG: hydrolase, partial [Myxococcales bacterium]
VGYHESVAGDLDRDVLDAMLTSRPLRIQHRTGAAWFLNTHACRTLRLDDDFDDPQTARGVERDASGRATGRLFRLDAWLAERTRNTSRPSLAAISRELAACGVTGVTDATYTNDADALAHIADAAAAGELLQKALVMGTHALPDARRLGVCVGAVKIVIDERDPPAPEMLGDSIARAHARGRAVAIHCVTRVELVIACAALAAAGTVAGDRVEHASIAPPELASQLAALGVTVVTQPSFVRERGDRYLVDVDERDLPWLYRLRGFDEAGVALAGGTDAPYGSADPWAAMRAAVDRRTLAGRTVGSEEAISPERALALFTSPPKLPGGSPRRVCVGAVADLVVLREPWSRARHQLSSDLVTATIRDGAIIWKGDS